jgi:hypothetical protein
MGQPVGDLWRRDPHDPGFTAIPLDQQWEGGPQPRRLDSTTGESRSIPI